MSDSQRWSALSRFNNLEYNVVFLVWKVFNSYNIHRVFQQHKTAITTIVEKNFATISLRFCISFAREKIENFAKNTELKKCRQKLKIVAINCYSDKTHGFLQNFREIFAFRISRHFFRESFRSLETLFLTRQCFSIVNLTSVFKITPKKVNFLFQIFARIIIHTSSFKSLFKNLNLALINK